MKRLLSLFLIPSLAFGQAINFNAFQPKDADLTTLAAMPSTSATAYRDGAPFGISLLSGTSAAATRLVLDALGTPAIGVTVQGYSANTTLLGNLVTGTGSIARNIAPTFTGSIDTLSASFLKLYSPSFIAPVAGTLTWEGAGSDNIWQVTDTATAADRTITWTFPDSNITYTMPTSTAAAKLAGGAQSITFAGSTAATTITLPSTSAFSVARIDAAQTFTGTQTFTGNISVVASLNSYGVYFGTGASVGRSLTDGNLTLYNNAQSGFTRLQLGGTSTAFPAVGRSNTELLVIDANGSNAANLSLGNSPSVGSGKGVFFIQNAQTPPTGTPTGGVILWAEGGALKARGSSGTTTTIANP